jgi:hypothetical protein
MSKTAGKENPLGPFGSVGKLHLGERTLNRVLTKQDKKRIRDLGRDLALERGFDPNLVRPVTYYCRPTLDVDILNIFTRKMGE